MAPEASRFVRETALGGGSFEVWRETIAIAGAAFLKPRFSGFDSLPATSSWCVPLDGRVVEELTGLGPKGAGGFWGLSAFGDELRLELRAWRATPRRPSGSSR